jgi:hypothetical protein
MEAEDLRVMQNGPKGENVGDLDTDRISYGHAGPA